MDRKRETTLFDSSQRLHLLRDNSISVMAPTNAENNGLGPGQALALGPGTGMENTFSPFHESCKLLKRKMSTETDALKWGYATLVTNRLNKLAIDEQVDPFTLLQDKYAL